MSQKNTYFDINSLKNGRLGAELSLWSADLGNLGEDILRVDSLADFYHIDVTDGHLSPVLTFFPDLMSAAKKYTDRPFHVHLMVKEGLLYNQIDQFVEAGCEIISIQAENHDLQSYIDYIHKSGCAAGLAFQLHTPISTISKWIDKVEIVTLLNVEVGLKSSHISPMANERLAEARKIINSLPIDSRPLLSADGCIREHTVPQLRAHGADYVVMGSLAFNVEDYSERMAWIRSLS